MPAAAALAVYVVITAVLFRELLPSLATRIYSDIGDPLLNVAILAWNAKHVPLSDAWWNFPSFAPLAGTTAFTEHLLGLYPLTTPIIMATGNALLAYNIAFVLTVPLNAWAAYLLARELTGSAAAAFIGGLAFAFAPYQSVHLSHLQTMMAFGMPLALLGLHRYIGIRDSGFGTRGSSISALALFGFGWLVTALSNAYMLVFFPVLVALWCAWFIRPREWRRLAAVVGTAALFALPLVPLLLGYQERLAAYGMRREFNEIRAFSADMVGLTGISHRELLWRGLLPNTFEEASMFPGVAILLLAIAAVVVRVRSVRAASPWPRRLAITGAVLAVVVIARAWAGPFGWRIGPLPLPPFMPFRVFTVAAALFLAAVLGSARFRAAFARRDPIVFYAAAAVTCWLLALGPLPEWSGSWRGIAYGPYWLLVQLPGLSNVRVPARMWLLAVLCLSVLAAAGAAVVRSYVASVPRRKIAVAAIAVAIVAEGWFSDKTQAVALPMPAGLIPPNALVLDLPVEQGFWNTIPQYRAVLGGYRTLNGYSGYEPPHFTPMRRAIADLLIDALNPWRNLADLYVVVRPDTPATIVTWLKEHPGIVTIARYPEMEVLRLPRFDNDAPQRTLLPLPRPGARRFGPTF